METGINRSILINCPVGKFFSCPKWTPSRDEHKSLSTVHFNANPSVHTRTSYTVSIEHCSINAFPGLTYKHVIVHKLYK
jgi:hypothetical protein